MQSVLLFASAALSTVHLFVLVPARESGHYLSLWENEIKCIAGILRLRASFPVNVLLERIQIKKREYFSSGIIGPKWRDYFLLYGASISAGMKETGMSILQTYNCKR